MQYIQGWLLLESSLLSSGLVPSNFCLTGYQLCALGAGCMCAILCLLLYAAFFAIHVMIQCHLVVKCFSISLLYEPIVV